MKRLITCSDGTWNKPGAKEQGKTVRTNVQKIFEAISKKDPQGVYQMKYYDEGVGAAGNLLTRVFNGATGEGIDDNIKDVYKFLVWNYEPGDEIYIFGFSRGAYTARSLAGLIRNCGILKNNDLKLIDEAYTLYRKRSDNAGPESTLAIDFKEKNSYTVDNIKFIGVWDTVGALGLPLNMFQFINKRKYAFHDTTLSSIVENAFHALAIDEKRKTFAPALWTCSKNLDKRTTPQVMEQKWFAGVHSNIGGGYPDEGLSDIALDWMIEKAKVTNLAFDDDFITNEIKPDYKATIYNSYSTMYRLAGKYIREIEKEKETNEEVHETAIKRFKEEGYYRPTPSNLDIYLKRKSSQPHT
ncbi:MAG: DUF2235 domain-containing protein [Sediminibacterium sp.]